MTYILILLIFMPLGAAIDGGPEMVATVVAEFNTRDACWDAVSAAIDPARHAHSFSTQATCAPKGQQGFGQ